ncbi:hypothetical protein TI39_contig290g00009 [Zymoseptoria brevis]|uniref:Uncharacterized protein n=1 Tax=Zymoseptoria brevis TaxID=1047168 RepID=A0A0F4GW58_9PEZI|nr:hypothetical protein TI39_contig290g00009 [Zymoseptoria brevis]
MFLPNATRTIGTYPSVAVSQGLETAANNLRQSNTDHQLLLAETRKKLAEAKQQLNRVSAAGDALNEKLKQTEAEVRKLTKWKFVLPRFEKSSEHAVESTVKTESTMTVEMKSTVELTRTQPTTAPVTPHGTITIPPTPPPLAHSNAADLTSR